MVSSCHWLFEYRRGAPGGPIPAAFQFIGQLKDHLHVDIKRRLAIYPWSLTAAISPDLFPGLGQPPCLNKILPEVVEALATLSPGKQVQVFHFLRDVDHFSFAAYCCARLSDM